MSDPSSVQAVTLRTLRDYKRSGRPIVSLTAYDASFAARLDEAGVDVVLVGDSLGMVVQGHATTLPVRMDDMVYHTAAVARGCRRALLMADLPFLSYADPARAITNAGRLMAEGGAAMVKLEGGRAQAEVVSALAGQGIPVCAHLGLRPQSVHKAGGFRVQGREHGARQQMLADAVALEEAGADMLLVECVPADLGAEITRSVSVPVIGIGAGPDCDGQILVLYDVLGITPGRIPRFAREFMTGAGTVPAAIAAYAAAVRERRFPGPEHQFS